MKVKMEIDLTPEEARELFVPGEKEQEFITLTYDAYTYALQEMLKKHVDPYNFIWNTNESKTD